MDIVTLGAALNGSAEYVNSHFKGGSNIQIVDNLDGTQTINASGEVSSEDTVARADIAAIKDGETLDSFGGVETALATKANTATTYTKAEVDTALSTKANSADVYSKSDIDTALSAKADKSTTYTKTEVDTALGDKVDKVSGKGLSTNDYTTTEKTKLAGIAEGAEANVQSNWAQTTTTADDYIKNKPTLGTAAAKNATDTYNATGTDVTTGKAVAEALATLPSGTVTNVAVANGGGLTVSGGPITSSGTITVGHSNSVTAKTSSSLKKFTYDAYGHVTGSSELSTAESNALASGIDDTKVGQIETNKNNISSIQQEQIAQNADIATLRLALDTKIYGIRIDKQDVNPDTRVTYLYDAVGMAPAYMDFDGGSFNYGSWADIWFVKNNRPVALKFDGTVDYELDHTNFTKKLDGTASDVSDPDYGGNFMSEMPTVYVKRWEDSRYNYIAFSDKQVNSDFLAQAHTNANGKVNSAIYLPMFKGWKDSNNKLRSLMGTYPTGNTSGTSEVTYTSNNGAGWQIWDKAKIDLIMDLIMLITKSTNCRTKIGNGDCLTYSASDTTNYGKMKSGYETDGTTRSVSAQFYGSEGTEVTNYGKHHMIAFYIEDLWGNRWDRCLGFNLVDNVYKVKMTAPYVLNSDSSYETLTVAPPSSEQDWLKNISSANAYGDVPTEVGASNTTGFANYFYKNASGNRLSSFGGYCNLDFKVGRYWTLGYDSGLTLWSIGGSPCFNSAT